MGKRIGRPRVTEREGFPQQFAAVVERIGSGGLSLRQAAKELNIGFATLKRLLDPGMPSEALGGTTPGVDPAFHNGKTRLVQIGRPQTAALARTTPQGVPDAPEGRIV